MAVKKSALYRSLWESCDQLRGGMDPSQYKDYVLVMLFVKYISDKYAGKPHSPVLIPQGASFADMQKLRGARDIGDRINKEILQPLREPNGLGEMPDFNDDNKLGSGKEKVERLTKLIDIFSAPELDFAGNRPEDDDLLGDAYEYLMMNFASESGKSKGQFYTPAEVSRLIARVLLIFNGDRPVTARTTLYDPACGSGALLLRAAAAAGGGTLYGQEKDNSTAALAKMNMFLHDMATADIKPGNTFTDPQFADGGRLETFDFVVANPPFSDKAWTLGHTPENDPYQRFAWGVPPPRQGDYAYLLHIIRSLKPDGKAACVLPHGVLFRGNKEGAIRRQLVQSGMVRCIVGLPANLFFGTGIPACIVFIDKQRANPGKSGIRFIDASGGYAKNGPKNRLREMDIRRIADAVQEEKDIPGFAHNASATEIAQNNHNLNIPRYVDSRPPQPPQNLHCHLHGGIPAPDITALAPYWQHLPACKTALVQRQKGAPHYAAKVAPNNIAATIARLPQTRQFAAALAAHFDHWHKQQFSALVPSVQDGEKPKKLIERLGDGILRHYAAAPLLNRYRAYEALMTYWNDTLQDDLHVIAADGWRATPEDDISDKGKNKGKKTGKWDCDLLPKAIVIAHCLQDQQRDLTAQRQKLAQKQAMLDNLEESQRAEGGAFADIEEGDSITAAYVSRQLKTLAAVSQDEEALAEQAALLQWQTLAAERAEMAKAVKTLEAQIDAAAKSKYAELSEDEVKDLLINHKWGAHMRARMQGETDAILHTLTSRMQEIFARYETALDDIESEAKRYGKRVQKHLCALGGA